MVKPVKPVILFVDQAGELGGAELSLLDIARSRREASRVLLFSDGPFRIRLDEAGVAVSVLGDHTAKLDVGRNSGIASALKALPALVGLVWKVLAEVRCAEVIYANTQKAFVVSAIASIISRKPIVWHLRDILTSDHFSGSMRRIAVGLANLRASLVIANSQATADAFRLCGGTAPIEVIYNGIDSAPFDAVNAGEARLRVRAEIDVPSSVLIGCFSRLAEWKGQHVLIEALNGLPNVHAVMVGGALFDETPYEASLHHLVKETKIADRVHFLGFRTDIPTLMKAVDVIVHTPIMPEPFGRVVVEGMLAGKPIVASRAGGILEIIEEGVDGILVPPNDALAVQAAVRALLKTPELSERLALAGRMKALHKFSLEACVSSVERVVCRALAHG